MVLIYRGMHLDSSFIAQYYGNMGFRVFKRGKTRLERFLPKNQHKYSKEMILNFENWCND